MVGRTLPRNQVGENIKQVRKKKNLNHSSDPDPDTNCYMIIDSCFLISSN